MTAPILALRIERAAVDDNGIAGVSFGDCLTIASTLARRDHLVDGDVLTTEIPSGFGGDLLSAVVRQRPTRGGDPIWYVALIDGNGVAVWSSPGVA